MSALTAVPLMLGGGALSAYGSIYSGKAQSQAAEHNAKVAKLQGSIESQRIRKNARIQQASARATISKSGVTSSGTPMTVLAESAANAEIDAINAAWGYRQRSEELMRQSKQIRTASYIQAGASLLASAGQAAGMMGGGG